MGVRWIQKQHHSLCQAVVAQAWCDLVYTRLLTGVLHSRGARTVHLLVRMSKPGLAAPIATNKTLSLSFERAEAVPSSSALPVTVHTERETPS